MKRTNIFKYTCLLGLFAVSTTSCEDWLTVYPQDRVVEEQFWEDKNDLEGVRYAAYQHMASTVNKMALWGDMRSDVFIINPNTNSAQGSRDMYEEIKQGMPDSSMSIFQWGEFYTTINYCNKVLQHGEEVLEKDKQFTTAEWLQIRAEMVALRALNYFYLIRAFKDVPYTTKVINNDTQIETFGLTTQLDILDSIILDCEKVQGQARNRFVSKQDSKGMITNCAIYAMLSDMYLWRASLHQGRFGKNSADTVAVDTGLVAHSVVGDYQKSIEYADKSLAALAYQNQEESSGTYNFSQQRTINFGLENCDMVYNDFEEVSSSNEINPRLEAQNSIFYGSGMSINGITNGNSIESIFELQFSQGDSRRNDIVNSLYGFNDGTHLAVSQEAFLAAYANNATEQQYDSRFWISCTDQIRTESGSGNSSSGTVGGFYCVKYMTPEVTLTEGANREIYVTVEAYSYQNWIVYRMTDVMLMKAEALACLGGTENNNECKRLVNAIHRRSYCDFKNYREVDTDINSGTYGNAPSTGSDLVKLVMNERQIELIAEGKRWFDLVRYAERNSDSTKESADERESTDEKFVGDGQTGVQKMVKDYMEVSVQKLATVLTHRFKNRYGLYCPIYYMEVKASDGKILQNPVWNKSKYDN
ncbi:MAG: RagB/SusD family nutrient uptake outer membrane protein [Bacteroidaceae bacterium]|nr:RagB/SusD family nutrient uptake outer membrane protein [Bacteroidaceae bacterium]